MSRWYNLFVSIIVISLSSLLLNPLLARTKNLIEKARKIQDKKRREAEIQQKKEEQKELQKIKQEERAIIKQERATLRKQWQEKRRAMVQEQEHDGKFADLYVVPCWPVYAQTCNNSNFLNLESVYFKTDRAFDSSGNRGNLAKHVFGTTNFKLRDILLTSDLVSNGTLATTFNNKQDQYLDYLADTQFDIRALWQRMIITLYYARRIAKRLILGISIPIVHDYHRINLNTTLPEGALDTIREISLHEDGFNQTLFRKNYSLDFGRFFDDILAEKGMQFQPTQNSFGLGDIQVFSHLEFDTGFFEQSILAAILIIPTGKHCSSRTVWAPKHGFDFWHLGGFACAWWSLDYLLNPHFFFQITHSFAKVIKRRIPLKKKFNGQTHNNELISRIAADGTQIDQLLIVAQQKNGVAFKRNESFFKADARVRHFADKILPVRTQQGIALWARVGNVIEKFLSRRAFIDIFYDFFLQDKSTTSLDKTKGSKKDAVGLIQQDRLSMVHSFGIDFTYQFNYHARFNFSAMYPFAGCNAPEGIRLRLSYNFDF